MLSQVRSQLGFDCVLGRFIHLPTIANLANQAQGQSHYTQVVEDFCAQLRSDCVLAPQIQPLSHHNNDITQPQTVLVTGVTGFLGAYMLAELLVTSDADVVCLVRATSQSEAEQKVVAKLVKYRLYQPEVLTRVKVIIGDLNVPKLGLSAFDYDFIANTVDSIMHVG